MISEQQLGDWYNKYVLRHSGPRCVAWMFFWSGGSRSPDPYMECSCLAGWARIQGVLDRARLAGEAVPVSYSPPQATAPVYAAKSPEYSKEQLYELFHEYQANQYGRIPGCRAPGHGLKLVNEGTDSEYVRCICYSPKELRTMTYTNVLKEYAGRKRPGCPACGGPVTKALLFTGTYDRCLRCDPATSANQ